MKKRFKYSLFALAIAGTMTACGKPAEATTAAETIEATTEATIEATTEAATEATTAAGTKAVSSGTLSDDIYSFQTEINGELYQFPMTMADFTAHGWKAIKESTEELKPDQYSVAERYQTGNQEIYVTVFNMGMDTIPAKDALVGGIQLDDFMAKGKDITLMLPKGIEFGKASIEDIIAAYGAPTDRYDGTIETKLTYSYDSYSSVEIGVSNESKVISSVEIRNLTAVEGAEAGAPASASAEYVPSAEVKAYVSPTVVEDDIRSFTADFAGNLYRMPAPVSVFLANGWSMKADQSDTMVASGDSGWVSLIKENQSMRVMAKNYGKNGDDIRNCFATTIKSETTVKLPMTIGKGITIDMTEADLKKALEGEDFVFETATVYDHYIFYGSESKLDNVDIGVNKETKKVEKITIDYSPRTLK